MSQYKLVPVEPNKAALIGEFKFKITETCPQCFYEEPREDCEICEGANWYQREITVPWDTTKEMYRAMLEAAPAVNDTNQAARIAELNADVDRLKSLIDFDTKEISELITHNAKMRGEIQVFMSILSDCRYPLLMAKEGASRAGEQEYFEYLTRLIRVMDIAMKGGA